MISMLVSRSPIFWAQVPGISAPIVGCLINRNPSRSLNPSASINSNFSVEACLAPYLLYALLYGPEGPDFVTNVATFRPRGALPPEDMLTDCGRGQPRSLSEDSFRETKPAT